MSYSICQSIFRDILEPMGSPIRAWEISRYFASKENRVTACSVSHEKTRFRKDGVEIRQAGIRRRSPFELDYLSNTIPLSRNIYSVCKGESVDIIHAHMFLAALASSIAKFSLGIPLIYDMHGLFPEEVIDTQPFFRKPRLIPWLLVEKILRKKSDFIVATSDNLKDVLIRIGIDEDKIQSVPVGVNTTLFTPGKKDNSVRKSFSLGDKKVILYAGSIEPYQGIDTLFRAIPRVVSQRKDAVFLIVGSGVEFDKYHRLSRKFPRNVIMKGSIDYKDMPDYVRSADVGLSLRRDSLMGHVSFPTKLTTYMSCGIPTIATSNGDQKSIIEKFGTGYLFRSGDPEGLSRRILEALDSEQELREMGKRSRSTVEKHYSWDVLCRRYESIYAQVLS
jgi:glycosyltransferase involved in cell wall biosynthesis